MRIRLKAEVSENKETPAIDNAASTDAGSDHKKPDPPDNESTTREESEDDTTVHSRSTTATTSSTTATGTTVITPQPQGKGEASSEPKEDEKGKEDSSQAKGGNLIGKINNLVTSDLSNITEGRDFLFIGMCDSS